MKHIVLILLSLFAANALARSLGVHCGKDSTEIMGIISSLKSSDLSEGDRMVKAAEALIGAGRDDYYSRDSIADLRINVHSFTPLMFVNNVIALVKASEKPGPADWQTFNDEFIDISTRRGEYHGFPSIMYHSSDWIGDNISRGNISELTENFSGAVARTKSLDEMTRKRTEFAALADSATFETVRMVEMGFRTHRIPSVKKEHIKKKEVIEELRNGDILLLVPNRDGIDIYDMGIIEMQNGVPYLIHLSPQTNEVIREKEELSRYMALMTKHFQGFRLLRLKPL